MQEQPELNSMLGNSAGLGERLHRDGWALVREKLTPQEFERVATTLGRIVLETPVRLTPEARTYLSSPKPLPGHTDHPSVEYIAWHCLRQDDEDGASVLIDTRPILEQMGPEAAHLAHVKLGCPPLKGLDPTETWPLTWSARGATRVYYAPWQRAITESIVQQRAYEAFRNLTTTVVPTKIRLDPGQVLVIDNRRILHGRGALRPGSQRELRRLWLISEE